MTEREIYMVVVGRVLWSIREADGMTQIQLAMLSGISTSAISRYEKGQTAPDLFELRALAGAHHERLVRLVEHVFKETKQALKQVRPNYTKDEVTAVVTLVMMGSKRGIPADAAKAASDG